MTDLNSLKDTALAQLEQVASLESLEARRIEYLGKNGLVTEQMKLLASMNPEEKKNFGAQINSLKIELTSAIEAKRAYFEQKIIQQKLASQKADVTLPARLESTGRIHPLSQATDEIIAVFGAMGFSVVEGPDIDDPYHNFDALNSPAHHPSRGLSDTFYFPGQQLLLRTQTSNMQVRTMETNQPPIKIISPGRCYRHDSPDMTHTPMFHQVEGLLIDKNIHMGHLKGCIMEFLQNFFETKELKTNFRTCYFPFTEPSAEVDISFKTGWLEVMGCGMVHPNVLRGLNIDPEEYQGFAFGMGIERLAMLKYGLDDLRKFYDGDVRWLKHFGFSSFDVPSMTGGLTR